MSKVDQFEVNFGEHASAYEEAAHQAGICKEGVFVLATYQDMLNSRELTLANDPVTARELVLRLAEQIETEGIPKGREQATAELLRYYAQFTVDRPIPEPDE